jgi:hypothetical protein
MALQPQDIASNFTITQIETRIASLITAIEAAEQSSRDSFSDTQANQSVMRQNLSELNDSLAIWLRAKNILTGNEDSQTELIAANYNPAWPRF